MNIILLEIFYVYCYVTCFIIKPHLYEKKALCHIRKIKIPSLAKLYFLLEYFFSIYTSCFCIALKMNYIINNRAMKLTRHFPKTVKVAAVPPPKSFYPDHLFGGNLKLTMFDGNLLSLLMDVLRFKSEILEPADKEYGRLLPDGNWTGLVGMVQKKEADISFGNLAITEERTLAVDFSFPYVYSSVTFITDQPGYTSDSFAVFQPFSLIVWCIIFFTLMLVALISYERNNSQSTIFLTYAILFQQSVKMKFNKLSSKLVISVWISYAIVITFCYKAVLLSCLTFPISVGIRDVSELAKASESFSFKCSTFEGNIVHSILKNGKVASWNKIAECMSRSMMFTDDIKAFLRPTGYKKAFVTLRSILTPFRKRYFISDDNFYINLVAIAVRKNFCCKKDIDELIHKVAAVGILEKFQREEEFFMSLVLSDLQTEELDANRKLSLHDVSGAFFVLLFGHILASTVFIFEVLFRRKITGNAIF